jgi:hypothetical protein
MIHLQQKFVLFYKDGQCGGNSFAIILDLGRITHEKNKCYSTHNLSLLSLQTHKKVLLQELQFLSASRIFPNFLMPEVRCCVHRILIFVPIFSQGNRVHALSSVSLRSILIIFLFASRSSETLFLNYISNRCLYINFPTILHVPFPLRRPSY